ncbi:Putative homeobox protein knotted-1-like 5 [Anopheles sinensis]|uniref:Putative homeobox protein knotted-1-like 5 n=1 Tax=Anopheles sinensis TaxID=74873 RepID=A0A084WBZ5_ANOSI|nr:Putative homeobox protein knotted-1-like 5 [Anopheles sinensis]
MYIVKSSPTVQLFNHTRLDPTRPGQLTVPSTISPPDSPANLRASLFLGYRGSGARFARHSKHRARNAGEQIIESRKSDYGCKCIPASQPASQPQGRWFAVQCTVCTRYRPGFKRPISSKREFDCSTIDVWRFLAVGTELAFDRTLAGQAVTQRKR